MFLEKVFHLVCCVSCRMLCSFVVYLYLSGSGSITSVGEERANLLMLFTCYCGIFFGVFSSSSGCLGRATLIYFGTP